MTNIDLPESIRFDVIAETDYDIRCNLLSKMTIGHGAVLFGESQRQLTDIEKLELTTTVD